jgi:hypothetical protein
MGESDDVALNLARSERHEHSLTDGATRLHLSWNEVIQQVVYGLLNGDVCDAWQIWHDQDS